MRASGEARTTRHVEEVRYGASQRDSSSLPNWAYPSKSDAFVTWFQNAQSMVIALSRSARAVYRTLRRRLCAQSVAKLVPEIRPSDGPATRGTPYLNRPTRQRYKRLRPGDCRAIPSVSGRYARHFGSTQSCPRRSAGLSNVARRQRTLCPGMSFLNFEDPSSHRPIHNVLSSLFCCKTCSPRG